MTFILSASAASRYLIFISRAVVRFLSRFGHINLDNIMKRRIMPIGGDTPLNRIRQLRIDSGRPRIND